jgi:NAD(P)-dependent dehydrogenase (short-subunit alcohol dehydrogenase family)
MDNFLDRLESAAELLEEIAEDRTLLLDVDDDLKKRLMICAGKVSRPGKRARKLLVKARRRKKKKKKRERDENLMEQSGIRKLRESPIFSTPKRRIAYGEEDVEEIEETPSTDQTPSEPIGQTNDERTCYVCQESFHDVHHFYDQMCIDCGDFNFAKRTPTADLSGRIALVTGARVKIGFQAALMLLQAGARVICLTRFAADAAKRYADEDDFDQWGDRLDIYGVDLRHTPSVEQFCSHLNRELPRLDFIINNACQTVRRPSGFYDHLMATELDCDQLSADERELIQRVPVDQTDANALDQLASDGGQEMSDLETSSTTPSAALLSQVELLDEDSERGNHLFPKGQLDADLQQVDLRKVNSWRLKLDDVSAIELLEVQLVNAVAPFILNARLKPLMAATPRHDKPTHDKHIVNVSAMEGQFYRVFKTDRHPHTNMAKAALNMMTRTSAIDYIDDGIHMNSVDTGWVTDEDPAHHAQQKRDVHNFHPPLDIVDGAARIVDPIFSGVNDGEFVWGQFLKDYQITDW